MCDGSQADHYVKDVNAFIEICRDVVDRLVAGTDDPRAGERLQLREIAKAIERLETAGVAVPDVLRG